jgi:hypothetical protein
VTRVKLDVVVGCVVEGVMEKHRSEVTRLTLTINNAEVEPLGWQELRRAACFRPHADVNFLRNIYEKSTSLVSQIPTFPLDGISAFDPNRDFPSAMSTPNKASAGAKTMSSRLANMKVDHYIHAC